MKKTIYSLICALGCIAGIWSLTACDDDTWGNDNEEMMNVFYFGFEDWGQLKNDVTYNSGVRANAASMPLPSIMWTAA